MSNSRSQASQRSWVWNQEWNDHLLYDNAHRQWVTNSDGRLVTWRSYAASQSPPSRYDPRTPQTHDGSLPDAFGSSPRQDPNYSLQSGQPQQELNHNMTQTHTQSGTGRHYARRQSLSTRDANVSPHTDQAGQVVFRSPTSRARQRAPSTSQGSTLVPSPNVQPFSPTQSSYGGNQTFSTPGSSSAFPAQAPARYSINSHPMSPASRNTPAAGGPSSQNTIYFRDEKNLVQTAVRSRPAATTDPALAQAGYVAHKELLGTDEEVERLYPSFQKQKKPRKFFRLGKVFMTLWTEPAGESNNTKITEEVPSVFPGKYNEMVFSKVRRFIVIRESDKYCSAVSIVSYGSQGVAKPGVKKSEHGIVFTGKTAPEAFPAERPARGEAGMLPLAVRVDPDSGEKLTPQSRINYGKIYTVEHNVKAKSMGTVSENSFRALIYQFKQAWASGISVDGKGSGNASEELWPEAQATIRPNATQNYNAALRYLIEERGCTREQAASWLKSKGKLRADSDENDESDDGLDDSEDDEDDNQTKDVKKTRMKKLIKDMQKVGVSKHRAAAIIRREKRRSAGETSRQEENEEQEDSEQSSDESSNETVRQPERSHHRSAATAAQSQQGQSAESRRFAAAVAALEQRGMSYQDAYRSVQQNVARQRAQASQYAAQGSSTGGQRETRTFRRDQRRQQSEESSEESDGSEARE